jgi:hypothetical protein
MAKVAKKSAKVTKVAKSATKAVTKKAVAVKERAPNPLHQKLIALMVRKDGATIADFQTVEGFNIPLMAVVKIARRPGYEASASKKQGERTRYVARKACHAGPTHRTRNYPKAQSGGRDAADYRRGRRGGGWRSFFSPSTGDRCLTGGAA